MVEPDAVPEGGGGVGVEGEFGRANAEFEVQCGDRRGGMDFDDG